MRLFLLIRADYIEKSVAADKEYIDSEGLRYGENSDTCLIAVSGNLKSMGIVKSVTNDITRILDYSKGDLVGHNISRIMPKVFADAHDQVMERYFESAQPRIINTEKLVYPINKSGYLVPCTLMVKILPRLTHGIVVLGFLREADTNAIRVNEQEIYEKVKAYSIFSIISNTLLCTERIMLFRLLAKVYMKISELRPA